MVARRSRGGRLRGLARGGAGSGSQRLSGQLDFGSQQVCWGGVDILCGLDLFILGWSGQRLSFDWGDAQ